MKFVIDETQEILAPSEIVWEVISDFSRYGQWNPFVIEAHCDLKVGAALDMQVKLRDKPQAQREWITACDPGTSFEYRMKPLPLGLLASRRFHQIEKLANGHSRYRSYFEIGGWLQPLVLAIFRRAFYTGFGGMNLGVKTRAEQLWAERRAAR